ncbi:MAG TPA: hypothetical protein VFS00_07865, partial [Polyangiaceae bacterium]|nr:hypothetical protein [Polyangiaceae bacterium]
MDAAERARLGAEILEELTTLLHERLAADAWGRLLVTLRPAGEAGGYRVASVDVDDIVGEESALERAFAPRPELDEVLIALAAATEALSALAGVDLGQTEGGTFLRRPEGGFAWLPGLVRAPSAAFEARRDREAGELERRWRALPDALRSARVEFDAEAQRASFFGPDGRRAGGAKALLVGSFSRQSRAWLWGWAHRDLP